MAMMTISLISNWPNSGFAGIMMFREAFASLGSVGLANDFCDEKKSVMIWIELWSS